MRQISERERKREMIEEIQMEGNSHKGKGRSARKKKNAIDEGEKEGGDLMECSGKYCGSCTAGVIADCVAICCCPCALLNFLTLALIKLPWKMGRRCLGFGKMKRKRKKNSGTVNEGDGNFRGRDLKKKKKKKWKFGARFEAESVWLELYQIGHWGFGRVSFTGLHAKRPNRQQMDRLS
ncbi:transmembrane protein [Gossypium australe]|uniref:Transmembrane protein n=1 Tax=Gossypium australe TaxID=47621 RepID=A0A5B6W2Q4_9ROSI|nr:transmembrane protein [Gossypium australe]